MWSERAGGLTQSVAIAASRGERRDGVGGSIAESHFEESAGGVGLTRLVRRLCGGYNAT